VSLCVFSKGRSEAVFPKPTEELERFGVKDKIVSFYVAFRLFSLI
jgi:hypothetical protein